MRSLIRLSHRSSPQTAENSKMGGQRMLWGLQKAVSLTLSFTLISAVLGLSQRSMSNNLFLFTATPPLPPPSQSFQMSVSSGASSLTSSPPNTHPNTLQICPIIAGASPLTSPQNFINTVCTNVSPNRPPISFWKKEPIHVS